MPNRTRREAASYVEAWDQATVAFVAAFSLVVAARTLRTRPGLSVFPPPDVGALEAEMLRLANGLRTFGDNDQTADEQA